MYTNTQNDNDALSMAPLLLWIPTHTKDGDLMVSLIPSWGKHLIYSIAEIVVAFKGIFLHRARWKIGDPRVPLWLQLAPFIFILRIVSYMFQKDGIWTCAFTMIMAGYYFAHLAHLTHVYGGDHTPDFLKHQLMNTKDIPSPLFPALIMFLDRQTLHHLLPTICHTRLTKDIRKKLSVNNFMVPFEYRSLYHIQTNVLRGNY
jgi:fatty acid desaturase